MNYEQAMDFIHDTCRLGSKLGLNNMQNLLKQLGNPHEKLKCVHVAGTNGKGSVCAIMSQILQQQGYKVGMYTSPYLYRFNERIRIDGQPISDQQLVDCCLMAKEACDRLTQEGLAHPTEFEVGTAMAFLHFFIEECDICIIEVGLGGRLDATNVIVNPLVCVLTLIDYDHTQYLGTTLTQIANEKCGIIKTGAEVVSYPCQSEQVMEVIESHATLKGCRLHVAPMASVDSISIDGTVFSCGKYEENHKRKYEGIKMGLLGAHQTQNAATAICATEQLQSCGIVVDEQSIVDGVAKACWQGRFQVISKEPLVIIDGAHNPSAVAAFINAVEDILPQKRLVFVMGMMKDKDKRECLALSARLASHIVFVKADNQRAEMPEVLAEQAMEFNKDVSTAESVRQGVERAVALAGNDGVVCVFGSLFILKEVKNMYADTALFV